MTTNRNEFLDGFQMTRERNVADRLLRSAKEAGAVFEWGSLGVSIRVKCSMRIEPVTVAWLYPPNIERGWMRTRDFSFGAGNGDGSGHTFGMDIPIELSNLLERWCDQFEGDSFTEDVSSIGAVAYCISPSQAAQHIDLLEARLREVIADLKAL